MKRILLLLSCIGLIISRSTLLFTEPRMWAEEASHYYRNAIYGNWIEGVFFLPVKTAGYFNIISSLPCTLAFHFTSIEDAPLFLTIFSLIIFIGVLARIIFIETIFNFSFLQKSLLCIGILFFIPSQATMEVWLNTINLQVFGGLISTLIVFTSPNYYKNTIRLVIDCLVLFLFALSGPYAIFCGIAFFLNLVYNRSKVNIALFSIISLGTLVQIGAFLFLKTNNLLSTSKTSPFSFEYVFSSIGKFFYVDSFIDLSYAGKLYMYYSLYFSPVDLDNGRNLIIQSIIGLTFFALTLIWIIKVSNRNLEVILKLSSIIFPSLFLITVFAMKMTPGGRYAFFPSFLILIILVVSFGQKERLLKFICVILITPSIIIGIQHFWSYKHKVFFAKDKNPTSWKDQIVELKKHPKCDNNVTVWPYPRWKFQFPLPQEIGIIKQSFSNYINTKQSPADSHIINLNDTVCLDMLKISVCTDRDVEGMSILFHKKPIPLRKVGQNLYELNSRLEQRPDKGDYEKLVISGDREFIINNLTLSSPLNSYTIGAK